MLFATCKIQFYFPYIFDDVKKIQVGKIGDQISIIISFEKATFKKSDQSTVFPEIVSAETILF